MSTLVFRIALGAAIALAATLGLFFAVYGNVNQDEGWYLYAAHLFWDGFWDGRLPYRDFAFFQPPLLPIVYGVPQQLLGPDLLFGRLTSLVLLFGTLWLAARLAFERGGRVAAIAALVVLSSTPLALWTLTSTRTEPLNAFLWTACAFLLLRDPVRPAASGAALLAAVLACATRIASLPAAGLVLLVVALRHRGERGALSRALAPGAAAALLLGAFLAAAGFEAAFFNLVTSQTTRHLQLGGHEAWGPGQYLATRLLGVSRLVVGYGLGPALAIAAGLVASGRWLARGGDSTTRLGAAALLTGLGVAVYVPNLVPRFVYPHYFASAFPLFAVLLAWGIAWSLARSRGALRAALLAGLAALLAIQAVSFSSRLATYCTLGDPQLLEVRAVGRELARSIPEGRRLLTLDTYLAVASRRPLPPGFEMGMFSYSPGWPEAQARRFGVATPALWEEALRDPSVGAVALSDAALGLLVRQRFGGYRRDQRLSEAQLQQALPGLEAYRLERVVPGFGQFDDPLYVLLPRAR